MGQMTKSTLLHINSGGGAAAGFDGAAKHISTSLEAFETPVWTPIKNKTYWSGVGQADAESVLHTNVLAFNISDAMMDAAATTMQAATLGFSTLQSNMNRLNTYAKSLGCWVHEDGTVAWDENNPNVPTARGLTEENKRGNVELAVKQTLKTATLLDESTKASLQTVYDNAPEVVETAKEAAGALPNNKKTIVEALDSRRLILEVSAGWLTLDSSLLGVSELKEAGGRWLLPSAAEHLRNLDELLKAVESGIGVTKAGPVLNALKLDLPNIIVDAIVFKADAAAGSAAAAGKKAADDLLKLPGRLAGVVGWTQFAADIAVFLAGKLAPEGEATSHPVVDINGDTKAHVTDFKLSHIASGFYYTHGYGGGRYGEASIADIARAQRLGAVEGGQFDYVEEAKQLRRDLQEWLDTHPYAHGIQNPDGAYARGLIAELDAALDGPAE